MSDSRDRVFPGSNGPSRLRRIVLEFESFRDFIQAFSPMVSEEGMFVGADFLGDAQPDVGEEVDFEVRLTDDFRLVHGRGEVAWLRVQESSDGPAGAAIAFRDLDEPSRRLVTRLINNYVKDGGKPFVLDAPASPAIDEASGRAVEPEPLERSEADELFAPEAKAAPLEQQELDSVAPIADLEAPEELSVPALDLEAAVPEADATPEIEEASESAADVEEPAGPPWQLEAADLPDAAPAEPSVQALDLPLEVESPDPGLEEAAPAEIEVAETEHEPQEANEVISEDIAQMAEELSGVHRVEPVEMPTPDERVELAGAASVRTGRSPWRTLLLASLAGIALGVAAWFFLGDQLKGALGLGGSDVETVAEATAMEVAETPPALGTEPGTELSTAADAAAESTAEPESVAEQGSSMSELASEVEAPATEAVAAAQAPVPEAPATAVAASESSLDGALTIEKITWSESGSETVVTIRVSGRLAEDSYEVVRIRQGAPREVIKIFGISSSFSPKQLEVGSSQVQRLRTGLHERDGRGEIHIVADLTGSAAAVTLTRVDGNELIVTFS